jgi:Reverse transcriptase (RNA-dependent DNA polymerase)
MTSPAGLNAGDDECVLLLKSLYGLVQSARQFFIKLREVSLKFIQSTADPCLFIDRSNNGIIIIAVYVDDCYVIGTESKIQQFILDIQQKGFKIKVEDKPSNYLSCEIVFDKFKRNAWLGQPHLLKKMEKSFGPLIKSSYNFLTPGNPNQAVVRPQKVEDRVSDSDQKIFDLVLVRFYNS